MQGAGFPRRKLHRYNNFRVSHDDVRVATDHSAHIVMSVAASLASS
jgi:hypothetical protein